jgi:transposase-like protein
MNSLNPPRAIANRVKLKRQAVAMVLEQGKSRRGAALEVGLPHTTVIRAVNQEKARRGMKSPTASSAPTSDEQLADVLAENAEYRDELAELRAENDALRKVLKAYIRNSGEL